MWAGWRVASSLLNVVFPSSCRICGHALDNFSRLPVCQDCLGQIAPLAGELCGICGERMPSFGLAAKAPEVEAMRHCGLCQRARPFFVRAVAFGAYEGALRELLHLFKYEGVAPAHALLGRLVAQAASELPLAGALVIPVPLHRRRRRERGFNQSELIARSAARNLRLALERGCLARTRATQSQTGLTRHQRRANLRGAFRVLHAERVRGRDLLLIDDVLTTGTTASECARVLLRAGARQVMVATVARVMKGESDFAMRAGEARAASGQPAIA